jgi:DNA polymerase-3 subunit gamma/tau
VTGYQTLYRKYRSQTFSDLVGQEAVSRALQGAVIGGRVAHAYLFSGTRGTGKTTSARLLAKALNCVERPEGSAEPCNRCESCLQVNAGAALDLIEIDAASNRGIDEIRELRERVALAPALGRRKVYIIDEAHMLTPEAFNALLKTLEEPPEHVVFILCTTEAQKVPLTVLGRCQQFVFRRLGDEQIVERLGTIAEAEGIAVEPEALLLVARTAQGSMRDAIGLLDQLVPLAAGTGGTVTLATARDLLGIADPALVEELVDVVLDGRPADALSLLGRIYEGGAELRQVVRSVMERCRDLLLDAIARRDALDRERLSAMLDALLHLDGEVRRHAEPRFLVEATLVRLAVEGRPGAAAGAATAAPSRVAAAATQPVVLAPPAVEPPPAADPEAPANSGVAMDTSRRWAEVLGRLNPVQRATFKEARPDLENGCLVLSFRYSFHHKSAGERADVIQAIVEEVFGHGTRIQFRLQDAGAGPAPRAPAPEEHPVVQAAVRQLEGHVTRVREIKETT